MQSAMLEFTWNGKPKAVPIKYPWMVAAFAVLLVLVGWWQWVLAFAHDQDNPEVAHINVKVVMPIAIAAALSLFATLLLISMGSHGAWAAFGVYCLLTWDYFHE